MKTLFLLLAILSEDVNPSDKFWKLDKRIKEDNKESRGSVAYEQVECYL